MKNIIKLGAAVLVFASCTDTWDDHYNSNESSAATDNLWEQISTNPNLTKFASLAEKVVYYKDMVHPLTNPKTNKPYTYKDVFNGTQLMTVFAPENDAISDDDYNKWLNMLETNPYGVHQQLMANSVALWRYNAIGSGIDTLQMINGKRMEFDKEKATIFGINLDDKNIEATNGTLHTLKGNIPFNYNLYEYLKDATNAQSNNLMTFHQYILDTDTTYFNERNSIEGNPDANGNPTYVDSAYVNTNEMFFSTKRLTPSNQDKNLTYIESFGANIEGEDSDFIMLLPTEAAWEDAYKKFKINNEDENLYRYANNYVDSEKGNSNVTASRFITEEEMDSITTQSIKMDIISPLVFNAHKQPKRSTSAPLWTSAELLAAGDGEIEHLINTFNDTLRTDDEWIKTSLFEGKQVQMSNGIGIVTDKWNFPKKFYQPNLTIEAGWQSWYNMGNWQGTTATNYAFSNAVASEWVDTVGRVSFNNFYDIAPSGAGSSIKAMIKLLGTDSENNEAEVMSGTYDIGIVVVPDFYKTSTDYITGDTVRHKITFTLNYCNNQAKSGANPVAQDAQLKKNSSKDAIDYDGLKVDTIWLVKDFKFPYSYKNLRFSYPTLEIGTTSASADRKTYYYDPEVYDPEKQTPKIDQTAYDKLSDEDKAKYTGKIYPVANNLCIDRIVMVAKSGQSSAEDNVTE